MRGSRKFCHWGSNSYGFFFVRGEKIQIALKAGLHLSASETLFKCVSLAGRWWWWPNIECWLGSFVIFQGIRTSIAKKPFILWFFRRGGGGGAPVAHVRYMVYVRNCTKSLKQLFLTPIAHFGIWSYYLIIVACDLSFSMSSFTVDSHFFLFCFLATILTLNLTTFVKYDENEQHKI